MLVKGSSPKDKDGSLHLLKRPRHCHHLILRSKGVTITFQKSAVWAYFERLEVLVTPILMDPPQDLIGPVIDLGEVDSADETDELTMRALVNLGVGKLRGSTTLNWGSRPRQGPSSGRSGPQFHAAWLGPVSNSSGLR